MQRSSELECFSVDSPDFMSGGGGGAAVKLAGDVGRRNMGRIVA